VHPSGRCDIPSGHSTFQASSVRTTRTFHPDLPLCREASKDSSLHPSRRFSSMSEHHSVFDQLWDFFSKQRYGKTTATVRTHSSIRQVVHQNQEVRTLVFMVRMLELHIWKLQASDQPSGRQILWSGRVKP
jgi:hypothetical protein